MIGKMSRLYTAPFWRPGSVAAAQADAFRRACYGESRPKTYERHDRIEAKSIVNQKTISLPHLGFHMRRLLFISAIGLAAVIGVSFAAGSAGAATPGGWGYATQEECMDVAWVYAAGNPGVKVWCEKVPADYRGETLTELWTLMSEKVR
jgi:hypothetical protein